MTDDKAWREARKKGLGGSDMAPLLGISGWTTPVQLFNDKLGLVERVFDARSQRRMDRGHRLEPLVCHMAEEELGLKLYPAEALVKHPRWSEGVRLLANPDRKVFHPEGDGIFEAKTTQLGGRTHHHFKEGQLDEGYALQVQHYMEVTDLDWCVIACLAGPAGEDDWIPGEHGLDFVALRVERHRELGALLAEIARAWWASYIMHRTAPTYTLHPRTDEVRQLLRSIHMGILSKVRPARDTQQHRLNMFVYGMPGAGKTYIAKTAADAGYRVLVLDAESGALTIRDSDADVLPIKSTRELTEVLRELARPGHGYDVVVLDSLTEVQKMQINEIGGQSKMKQQTWGTIGDDLRTIVRQLRDLPLHVIAVCLSKETEDDDVGCRVRPALSGSMKEEVSGFFDLVGYAHVVRTEKGPRHRLAFTSAGDRLVTKDRSGRLDEQEPNDFGHLLKKVFAEGAPAPGAPNPEASKSLVGAEAKRLAPLVGATVAEVGGVICRALGVASSADLPSVDPARVTEVLRELEAVTDAASFEAWKKP